MKFVPSEDCSNFARIQFKHYSSQRTQIRLPLKNMFSRTIISNWNCFNPHTHLTIFDQIWQKTSLRNIFYELYDLMVLSMSIPHVFWLKLWNQHLQMNKTTKFQLGTMHSLGDIQPWIWYKNGMRIANVDTPSTKFDLTWSIFEIQLSNFAIISLFLLHSCGKNFRILWDGLLTWCIQYQMIWHGMMTL